MPDDNVTKEGFERIFQYVYRVYKELCENMELCELWAWQRWKEENIKYAYPLVLGKFCLN